MPSRSNKFNSLSSRSTRAKCKLLLMASLIKQIELQPLYLKEYLGILLLKVAIVKIWSYLYNKEYGQLKGAMNPN